MLAAPISIPRPFTQKGINLIGPLLIAKGKVKYAIVTVDYFMKSAEGEPLVRITKEQSTHFMWKAITCSLATHILLCSTMIDNLITPNLENSTST